MVFVEKGRKMLVLVVAVPVDDAVDITFVVVVTKKTVRLALH